MSVPLHAPYGFVPLNDDVFCPEWNATVTQDFPVDGGFSGTFRIAVEAETDIFVRGATDPTSFFRGPEGKHAIPGSSLRGAIRSIVEIASFGYMRRANNHRYGVRDLQNQNLYVRHMAGIMRDLEGLNQPLPKVVAGWLQKNDADRVDAHHGLDEDIVATITPCDFAKVEYQSLIKAAKQRGVNFDPGRRQSAPDKYRSWGVKQGQDGRLSGLETLKLQGLSVKQLRPRDPAYLGMGYGKATLGDGALDGTLVITGQPSPWDPNRPGRKGAGQPKHHDFVFFDGDTEARNPKLNVSRKLFEGFEFVHSDGQEQHSINRGVAANAEWKFWKSEYDKNGRVPVFFLVVPNQQGHMALRAFGLAMMFRLAYNKSIGEVIERIQPKVRDENLSNLDFAETLFGNVSSQRGRDKSVDEASAIKGRVSFGLARLVSGGTEKPAVTAVLGAPKASFYPAYVEQSAHGDAPGRNATSKDSYATYMDDNARIRGHKRYRVQPDVVKGPPLPSRGDGSTNTAVGTSFKPLTKGARFEAEVRVHNLYAEELGGLLWALDFGGEPDARHTLGMAKSLGYGRCKISLISTNLLRNDDWEPATTEEVAGARASFATRMEDFCKTQNLEGGWLQSRRIYELVELAKPVAADSPHRYHLNLKAPAPYDNSRTVNEFIEAKKGGLALPSAGTDQGWMARAMSAGTTVQLPKAGVRAPQPGGPGAFSPAQQRPAATGGGSGAFAPSGQRPSAYGQRPAPVQAAPANVWTSIARGTEVEVEITSATPKGKWRAKVVDRPAFKGAQPVGVVSFGEAPADIAAGQRLKVIVEQGGDPTNLGLRWK
ncbi:MAG: TIGR03986 family CRISPR-associated RAMP protein [Deltaproteobacteria bacterium]|nr:TIGR03986 family CRISPR-associated RAMP protein [Deltaproteobacteria bacterium]